MTIERRSLLNQRYRILEILGQGGMGAIYRAVDENLGVEVAVKENLFTTEEYARQFRREALILASLRHPNLPRVTDHFVIEGQGQYLVMDYIEGEDMRERMDRLGLLSDQEVIVVGAAICDALTYLHTRTQQVVHRDIKPGNVKISPSGNIVLVDFGLAKVVQGSQATTTGARAMTPGYSPPEQYGTARTDHRTDIFSLGATLYVALTAMLPEDSLARAMGQAELTPIRKYNPRVSRRLAAAIEKALELRPNDRYQSAEEMKRALLNARSVTERRQPIDSAVAPPPEISHAMQLDSANPAPALAVAENPSPLTPIPPEENPSLLPTSWADDSWPVARRRGRERPGFRLLLMLASLFTLGGIGVYLIQPALFHPLFSWVAPIRSETAEQSATRTPTGNIQLLALSRTPLAPATKIPQPSSNQTQAVILPPTSTPTPRPSPTPTQTSSPTATVTPLGGDGGQIAYASDISGLPQIWVMNSDGTGNYKLTDMPEGACQPDWSPDGMRLVFISPCAFPQEGYPGASLFLVNADGTNLAALPTMPGGDFDPAWSPDGQQIAFTSLRYYNRPQIITIHLADNTTTNLSDNIWRDTQPAWSPDGSRLAFISQRRGAYQIWTMAADGSDPQLFSRSGSLKDLHPRWSPDGLVIAFSQSNALGGIPRLMVARYNYEGERYFENQIITGAGPMREPAYSPDGFWVAYEGWPEGANHDIYIMTTNGLIPQQLTSDASLDFDPAWRPAGKIP